MRLCLFAAVIAALSVIGAGGTAQAAEDCDRDCLAGFLDSYLEALKSHDSAKLPVTKNVKYTENGVRLTLNDGLWHTVMGEPEYRITLIDEEAGSVGMLGIINENGNRNFFATRLKVEKGEKVSEIENLVVRNIMGRGFGNPDRTEPHPRFSEKVPEKDRLSRAELVRIANSYFTGLDTDNSGRNVPFDPDCQRRENGAVMANSDEPEAGEMQKRGCKEQFDTGFSVIVTDIRERRFEVVDPELGLAFGWGFFDHDGSVEKMSRTLDGDLVDVAPTFRQPFSFYIAEIFEIEDGRIRQIEAVLTTVPYGMPSGW